MINSITKSYILNIKIRPLMTEYALMIKLVGRTIMKFWLEKWENIKINCYFP